ncbi:DUF2730 family protein [Acinetobacter junii]|uniref:DUF2730 family protein n=1 Tax=Acinetobacter junii TaxID=40215 RepID=UPI00124C2C11|nr:DUF2730 family protein [Acinetobacter junii]
MFEFLKLGFAEVNWLVVTAIGIYGWVIKKYSASAQELAELRVRVVQIENSIKDMPSKEELAEIEGDIKVLTANIGSIANSVEKVDKAVTRIESHLIDKSK